MSPHIVRLEPLAAVSPRRLLLITLRASDELRSDPNGLRQHNVGTIIRWQILAIDLA